MSFPARETYRGPGRGGGPGHAHQHSRSSSAIEAMLGQAGQALGAIAAPSPSTTAALPAPVGARAPAHPHPHPHPDLDGDGQHRLHMRSTVSSPTSPSFGFGAIGHYPQHLSARSHPALPLPPPTTTDTSLHLPPPFQSSAAGVPGTGTGTGTGIGFGSKQRAVSAAASASISRYQSSPSPPPPTAAARHRPRDSDSPATSSSSNARATQAPYSPAPYAQSARHPSARKPLPQHSRALAAADALIPALSPQSTSNLRLGSGSGSRPSLSPRSMFGLPSIPTSNDDFASSIPHLNPTPDSKPAPASTTTASTPAPATKDTMSQQQQQQQYAAPTRRTVGYEEQHHMSGPGPSQYQHGQISPREYSTPSAGPQIKLDQIPSNPPSYQGTPAVPSVLQPGGPIGRPQATGTNTAPTLPTMQGALPQHQQDYQTPSKPSLSLSHSYSRSSPAAGGYDVPNPGYSPYTPTTPGGSVTNSSQFMSPTDRGYNAPGSQRNMSHTPLGLADIRPRADSTLSDGLPSGIEFSMQNTQPGTSNYMAPWATYAFDWCKWAPQGNGAGKVAIGSYLEDGHNFVSLALRRIGDFLVLTFYLDRFKSLIPKLFLLPLMSTATMAARSGLWTLPGSRRPHIPIRSLASCGSLHPRRSSRRTFSPHQETI